MPERPRVLQMGPDPSIGGGMSAALRGLLSSPLADRYELEMLPTYDDPAPLRRVLVYIGALFRLAAWSLRGRGRIVHIHATVRGSMYRKAVVVLLAKALRRRVVLHIHSGAGDVAKFAASRDRLSLALFRAGMSAADTVLAVSDASAEAFAQHYGVDADAVVPNAAPLVAPFERPAAADGSVRVAYIGGFANWAKAADVMVAALERALPREPRLRVTLAGPGEPTAEAAELLAADERLEWIGWLEPAQKDELLRAAEVFVISSRTEGLPMALLEAMAHGMAVVATDVGGIPEVVADGEDGLLVPPEDPDALAEALCRLAAEPELRRRLAAAARRRVESLDANEVAARLDALYAALL